VMRLTRNVAIISLSGASAGAGWVAAVEDACTQDVFDLPRTAGTGDSGCTCLPTARQWRHHSSLGAAFTPEEAPDLLIVNLTCYDESCRAKLVPSQRGSKERLTRGVLTQSRGLGGCREDAGARAKPTTMHALR